jgi:hypothetical protein
MKKLKEKPEPKNIFESALENELNKLEALGGKKACAKYLKLYRPMILSTDHTFHDSMSEYLTKLKEFYK